jgi:hypothetical protein
MNLPISTYVLTDVMRSLLMGAIKFFIALCLVQLVALVVHKVIVERRERQAALLRSRYLAVMYRLLDGEPTKLVRPATKAEFTALADVCIYLMPNADLGELEIIRETVRSNGVPEYFISQFHHSRFWIARLKLIEKLGFLKLPELAPLFRSIVDAEHEERHVAGKATWALSLICSESDLPHILSQVTLPQFMSAKFNEHLFVNIIHSFTGAGATKRLLELFEELLNDDGVPLLVKRDFIEACGGARLTESLPLIVSGARRFEKLPEMRIACLRSLQKLGSEELDSFIVAGLRDEDWRVRAVAAKSVELCSDVVIDPLEQALGDANYHVRLNAALSLAHKGAAGRAALDRQRASRDRFVREVSRYVMQGG